MSICSILFVTANYRLHLISNSEVRVLIFRASGNVPVFTPRNEDTNKIINCSEDNDGIYGWNST